MIIVVSRKTFVFARLRVTTDSNETLSRKEQSQGVPAAALPFQLFNQSLIEMFFESRQLKSEPRKAVHRRLDACYLALFSTFQFTELFLKQPIEK